MGPPGAPFQAGARGKIPQLPPPVGGPEYVTSYFYKVTCPTLCIVNFIMTIH